MILGTLRACQKAADQVVKFKSMMIEELMFHAQLYFG